MIDNHNRCLGGRIWFVKDVCGIICALFTWFLIIFAQYVVITVILIPDDNLFYKTTNFIIFELLAFLAIISHIRTMITDPVSFYVCMLFSYLYMLICCFILHSHLFQSHSHSLFHIPFLSVLIREQCPVELPPKRLSNSWGWARAKCCTNAKSVVVSSLNELITVQYVKDASGKWIITVHGSTTVLEKTIRSFLYCSL